MALAGAVLLGWYGPDLVRLVSGGQEGKQAVIASQGKATRSVAASSPPDSWHGGATVLRREADGHFYADVGVDGARYRFLVDTGASIVALTGADAEAMGLNWDEGNLQPVGRGASGPVYGVPVLIPRMEVGGIEAREVEAAIIPEGLGVSLLGQSFLSQVSDVRISGDELRLGG
ncbi:MAG: TIGR02281 family clan AA aspartic protease [Novosphingobium sp.]|nr:TIGR02281 family clan AA aspartic protease [Novosphingobium sp.]